MPTLSIIIPVLNERANVPILVERLNRVLAGVPWEVVFVDDDSLDGTADACREIAAIDPRVRVIQRIGRLGLASACVEGMLSTVSPYMAVMDGDLQHDEALLPRMLETAQTRNLDLVIASRNIEGGSMGEFAKARVQLSNLGRFLSRLVMRYNITDPMSGFFLLKRELFDEVVHNLSQIGFKILLDIAASTERDLRFAEVPYTFSNRLHGESKLDSSVGLDFLLLVIDKLFGRFVPARFVLYSLVGLSGMVLHLTVLTLSYAVGQLPIVSSQVIATTAAIVWNFFLNNKITYRDRKLRGWGPKLKGFLVYGLGCSIGAVANVSITEMLMSNRIPWWLAGVAGMMLSSVWNFGIANAFAWKLLQRRRAFRARYRISSRMNAQESR